MNSLQQLEEQKKKQAAKKPPPEPDDDVEITMEMPHMPPLNTGKSVFDRNQADRAGGINTAESVFDKKAVFRTPKEEDENG